MKIIADSGSTKTDWRLITRDNRIVSLKSPGINPFHRTATEINATLAGLDIPDHINPVSHIYFYGAGVTGNDAEITMKSALQKRFGLSCDVFVGDDLLAAARALLENSDGIACILGTGSNSCFYRNGIVENKIPALGFILGDEGSGTDMGKRFINALFKKTFPEKLTKEIIENEKIDMHIVLDKVYRSEYPARELATYSKMVKKYIDHEAVARIATDALDAFFSKNIARYENFSSYKAGFAGSIAYHFRDILEQVANKWGMTDLVILSAPIDELVNYHSK